MKLDSTIYFQNLNLNLIQHRMSWKLYWFLCWS